MNSYGFSENDISKILISHAYKDHIHGLGRTIDNRFECYFPNAKIYIQKQEMDFALTQKKFSYDITFLNQIKNDESIIYLNQSKGIINDVISYEVFGGIVPFQQVFWLKEDCEIAFFGADNLPQLNYLKYQAAFKNDLDGVKAMNDRIEWHKKAQLEN